MFLACSGTVDRVDLIPEIFGNETVLELEQPQLDASGKQGASYESRSLSDRVEASICSLAIAVDEVGE